MRRPKVLFHTTPKQHLPSVKLLGLLPALSETARKEVWLHTIKRLKWARLHLSKRHCCRPRDMVTVAVNVSGKNLLKRRRGIYTTETHIPRCCIVGRLA